MYTTDDLRTAIRILKERHTCMVQDIADHEVTLKSLEKELRERSKP